MKDEMDIRFEVSQAIILPIIHALIDSSNTDFITFVGSFRFDIGNLSLGLTIATTVARVE
jgi:hypothetical protein